MKENIKDLFASEVSNYRISKDTGISQPLLAKYSNGISDIDNMTLGNALKLNDYYNKIKGDIKMRTWEYEKYTVETVDHDYDLKAFEITQGEKVQTIYPATIEDMEQIIEDLDNGEDVEGWEDGQGNSIVID